MKINFLKLNKISWKDLRKNNKGIAIVESLVSVTIVIISIMGPIILSVNAAKFAKFGLNKISATNFANEQIEMMVKYKKSLDLYCFNNSISCNGNNDGFEKFTDSFSIMDCEYDALAAVPCSFDESSFTYVPSSLPTISKKTSCILYTQTNDIVKCDDGAPATADRTVFSRKVYIDVIDTMKDHLNGDLTNAVRVTSLVCINNPTCDLNSKKTETLILISYIYR
jgi:Tfp pilus assembly protein PilV